MSAKTSIWTDERDERLKALYAQPLNQIQVAAQMSEPGWLCTELAVKARLKKLGITRDKTVLKVLWQQITVARSNILNGWTAERIEQLEQLIVDGHSSSAISKIMGVSRNTICGKAHRMGFRLRSNAERSKTENAVRKRAAPKTPTKPRKAPTRPVMESKPMLTKPKTLLELGHHECRWPLGSFQEVGTADTLYCGAPVRFHKDAATSWCPSHALRCYAPAKPKGEGSRFNVGYVQARVAEAVG